MLRASSKVAVIRNSLKYYYYYYYAQAGQTCLLSLPNVEKSKYCMNGILNNLLSLTQLVILLTLR